MCSPFWSYDPNPSGNLMFAELGKNSNSVGARKRSFDAVSGEDYDNSPPSKSSLSYSSRRSNKNSGLSSSNVKVYADEAAMLEQFSKYILSSSRSQTLILTLE